MSSQMRNHLFWGYFSLAVLGTSGLVMNVIVSKLLGVAALGVFNQSFAIYIIASQIAAGGVHYAVLRQVAQNHANQERIAQILQSSLLLTIMFSLVVAVILLSLQSVISHLFDSVQVAASVPYVAGAVGLFAVNKCLLATLNGLERMRDFSILQSLRYIIIVAALLIAGNSQADAGELSAAFLFGEAGVCIVALLSLLKYLRPQAFQILKPIMLSQARFGAKGFVSGLLLEANTRVDILLLGVFTTDARVGVYSFPAIIAEGALQSLVVVRNIFNPQLAKAMLAEGHAEVRDKFRATAKLIYPGFTLLMLGALLGLYVVLNFFLHSPDLQEQMTIATILLLGILVYSAYVPFDQLLIHVGKPGYHSWLIFIQVLTNIVLNLLLIPKWGLMGSAIATGLAFALNPLYLNIFLKRHSGFSLGIFRL